MRVGRPSYHIPAKWITVKMPQGLMYFELGEKGTLINNHQKPHHIVPRSSNSTRPQNIPVFSITLTIPPVSHQPVSTPTPTRTPTPTTDSEDNKFIETVMDFGEIGWDMVEST
jgi:hypothetical protein